MVPKKIPENYPPCIPFFAGDDKSRCLVHQQSDDLRGITVLLAHYDEKQVLP